MTASRARESTSPTGMDRAYFLGTGVVSENLVDSPASWQYVSSPIQVTGIARAFEANVQWALFDADGLQLRSEFTTASIAGPDWGDFNFSVEYTVDRVQVGTLQVWEESAQDGSKLHLRETTLWLTP